MINTGRLLLVCHHLGEKGAIKINLFFVRSYSDTQISNFAKSELAKAGRVGHGQ